MMKIVSLLLTPPQKRRPRELFSAPYISGRSLQYTGLDSFSSVFVTFILSLSLTASCVVIGRMVFSTIGYWQIVLLSPVILFMTEALGALGQMLFYFTTPKSFPIHHRPLSSQNLGQFWGRHWNLWVQDWLKDVSSFWRGKMKQKLFITFLVSGFFHEIMVNLPYWIVYRKSYIGTMFLYFAIQGLALAVEKRFMKSAPPILKRAFMIAVVFLPSPLFVNVPVLTFLGFIHG